MVSWASSRTGGWVPRRNVLRACTSMCKCLSSLHLYHACHGPIGQSSWPGQIQSQSGKQLHKGIKSRKQGSQGTSKVSVHHRSASSYLCQSIFFDNMLKFINAYFAANVEQYLASINSENPHNNLLGYMLLLFPFRDEQIDQGSLRKLLKVT